MADHPYNNFFKGYYNHYMFPPPSSSSSTPITTHNFYSTSFSNYTSPFWQSQTSPPSPPLREALPLLNQLTPTKQQQQQQQKEETSCSEHEENMEMEEEAVSVALHIGLPSPSEVDLISRVSNSSSTSVNEDKEEDGGGDGSDAVPLGHPTIGKLTRGQYWIPTPSQILIGPTQFSCPVCCKTCRSRLV